MVKNGRSQGLGPALFLQVVGVVGYSAYSARKTLLFGQP